MKKLIALLTVALMIVGFAGNASATLIGCYSEAFDGGWDADYSSSAYFGYAMVYLMMSFDDEVTGGGYAIVNEAGMNNPLWTVSISSGYQLFNQGVSIYKTVECMTHVWTNSGYGESNASVQG